ncbi:MAG: hypothetical protein J5637_00360 [Prevotella sp.]|nr:hypothetical protein [Prevotella sp.]
MKTRNFKNSMKVGAAFAFAAAMTLALSAFSTTDCKMMSVGLSESHMPTTLSKNSGEVNEVMCAALKLKEIGAEKASLEQKMMKEKENLMKAKEGRNKDYGMAAGIYYQPASGLSEVTYLEGKIYRLNVKINELNEVEKAINEKYGNDLKDLNLV